MSKNPPKQVYIQNTDIEILNNYELLNHLRDDKDLLKSDLLIALVLASRRNAVRGCAFPSVSTIENDTGLSHSGVIKSIKNLKLLNFLIVINTGKCYNERTNKIDYDGKTGNVYYFTYDLNYQNGLIEEDERHPLNKDDRFYDLFKLAYDEYN